MPGRTQLQGATGRNYALDYLRASALLLMSLIHMWRYILGRSGADAVAAFVGEAAPFPFFLAFGMTQTVLVRRNRQDILPFLVLFGFIGIFHGYFMLFTPAWEFFLFLWSASLLIVAGSRLQLRPPGFFVLGIVVLAINVFLPLGVSPLAVAGREHVPNATREAIAFAQHLWVLPGPFFPLPWAVVVFFGFAIGVDDPEPRRMLSWGGLGLLAAVTLAVLGRAEPNAAFAPHLALEKWAGTSPYLLAGCGGTLVLYAGLAQLCRVPVLEIYVYPLVRFISDHLMEGTILHYLVVRVLTAESVTGPWRAVWGMRRMHWSAVLLLSVVNVVLLLTTLKAVIFLWSQVQRHLATLWDRIGLGSAIAVSLTVWAIIRMCLGVVRPGYPKWLAYAAMLGLALFYRVAKEGRRKRGDLELEQEGGASQRKASARGD